MFHVKVSYYAEEGFEVFDKFGPDRYCYKIVEVEKFDTLEAAMQWCKDNSIRTATIEDHSA